MLDLVDPSEHLLAWARTCDRVYALNFGTLTGHGTQNQIRANPAVVEAYLGTSHRETEPDRGGESGNGHVVSQPVHRPVAP